MARKANNTHLDTLKQAIYNNPGKKASWFAKLLGWKHEDVNRRLTTLNDQNHLLYEDEHGGLWDYQSKS